MSYTSPRDQAYNVAHSDLNASGQYAPLDAAYNSPYVQSGVASEAKVNNDIHSYLASELLITPQSEEKINDSVDQLLGAYYKRDQDFINQNNTNAAYNRYLNLQAPMTQDGINFPLNRMQQYPPQKYGSELLEGYDGLSYNTKNNMCDIMKFLLVLLVVIVIIYLLYWIFTDKSTKSVDVVSSDNVKSFKFAKYLKNMTFH